MEEEESEKEARGNLDAEVRHIADAARRAIADGQKALRQIGVENDVPVAVLPPRVSGSEAPPPASRALLLERSIAGGGGQSAVDASLSGSVVLQQRAQQLQRQLEWQRVQQERLEELERQEHLDQLERQERRELELAARRSTREREIEQRAIELERWYARRGRQLQNEARAADQKAAEVHEQLEALQSEQEEREQEMRQELAELRQATQRTEAQAKQRMRAQRDSRERAEKAVEAVRGEARDFIFVRDEVVHSEKANAGRLRRELADLSERHEQEEACEAELATQLALRLEELSVVEEESEVVQREAAELDSARRAFEEHSAPLDLARAAEHLPLEVSQQALELGEIRLRAELHHMEERNYLLKTEEQGARRRLAEIEEEAADLREALRSSPQTVVARFAGVGAARLAEERDVVRLELGAIRAELERAASSAVQAPPAEEPRKLGPLPSSAGPSPEVIRQAELALCDLKLLQAESEEARLREETYRELLEQELQRLQADPAPLLARLASVATAGRGGSRGASTGTSDGRGPGASAPAPDVAGAAEAQEAWGVGETWWDPLGSDLLAAAAVVGEPVGSSEECRRLRRHRSALIASMGDVPDGALVAESLSSEWMAEVAGAHVEAECEELCREADRLLADGDFASKLADTTQVEVEVLATREALQPLEERLCQAEEDVSSTRFEVEAESRASALMQGRLEELVAADEDLERRYQELGPREQAAADACSLEEHAAHAVGEELEQARRRYSEVEQEVQAATAEAAAPRHRSPSRGFPEDLPEPVPHGCGHNAEADLLVDECIIAAQEEAAQLREASMVEAEAVAQLRAELASAMPTARLAGEVPEAPSAVSAADSSPRLAAELEALEARATEEEEALVEVTTRMSSDELALKAVRHRLAVGRGELAFFTAARNLEAIDARLSRRSLSERERPSAVVEEELQLRSSAEKLLEESVLMLDNLTRATLDPQQMAVRAQRLKAEVDTALEGLATTKAELVEELRLRDAALRADQAEPSQDASPRLPERELVAEVLPREQPDARGVVEVPAERDAAVLAEMQSSLQETYGLLAEQQRAIEAAAMERDRLQAQLMVVSERISRQQAGLALEPPASAFAASLDTA